MSKTQRDVTPVVLLSLLPLMESDISTTVK
jgi:hypothetical protein